MAMLNQKIFALSLCVTSMLVGTGTAFAACECKSGITRTVPHMTNYTPCQSGGADSINGNCNTSSTPGYKAGDYVLEDHIGTEGRAISTPAVMMATPQNGNLHEMFGGLWISQDLAQDLGKQGCIQVAAVDHYARAFKGIPIEGRLDVNTRGKDTPGSRKNAEIINKNKSRLFCYVGKAPRLQAPKRHVQSRNKWQGAGQDS